MARRKPISLVDTITDPDYVNVVYVAEGLAIAELERLPGHYALLAKVCRGIPRDDYATKVDATAGEMAAGRMVAGIDWLITYYREREAAAEKRLTELMGC